MKKSSRNRISFQVLTFNLSLLKVTPGRFDEVTEHGSVDKYLAHIKVSDPDSGVNGQVTCSIADPHFSLKPLDSPGFYKIILSKELDREEAAQREVEIRCRDGDVDPLEAIATLPISVR